MFQQGCYVFSQLDMVLVFCLRNDIMFFYQREVSVLCMNKETMCCNSEIRCQYCERRRILCVLTGDLVSVLSLNKYIICFTPDIWRAYCDCTTILSVLPVRYDVSIVFEQGYWLFQTMIFYQCTWWKYFVWTRILCVLIMRYGVGMVFEQWYLVFYMWDMLSLMCLNTDIRCFNNGIWCQYCAWQRILGVFTMRYAISIIVEQWY